VHRDRGGEEQRAEDGRKAHEGLRKKLRRDWAREDTHTSGHRATVQGLDRRAIG
jgi:hypothetical protein